MEDPIEPQSLKVEIWDDKVPNSFKPPLLATFDGKSDPYEHIITINTQMTTIEATNSLKYKLMVDTLKDVVLHWYMSLLRFFITNYHNLYMKVIYHFYTNKHKKVSTTSLFNVCQGNTKSLWEYLAHFDKETMKVSHPNQEIFIGDFQNDLKAGHFNESLAQKSVTTIKEIMTWVEYYIKGD